MQTSNWPTDAPTRSFKEDDDGIKNAVRMRRLARELIRKRIRRTTCGAPYYGEILLLVQTAVSDDWRLHCDEVR